MSSERSVVPRPSTAFTVRAMHGQTNRSVDEGRHHVRRDQYLGTPPRAQASSLGLHGEDPLNDLRGMRRHVQLPTHLTDDPYHLAPSGGSGARCSADAGRTGPSGRDDRRAHEWRTPASTTRTPGTPRPRRSAR